MENVTGETNIAVLLKNLIGRKYGEEVRGSIHDAILQTYKDASTSEPSNSIMEVILARGTYKTLGDRLNSFEKAIEELKKSFEALDKSLLDKFYPVGSIYESKNKTSPATLFGGTWQECGKGAVMVGIDAGDNDFNQASKKGGSKTQRLYAAIGSWDGKAAKLGHAYAPPIPGLDYNYGFSLNEPTVGVPSSKVTHSTAIYQHDASYPSTVQPYEVCYRWERTS